MGYPCRTAGALKYEYGAQWKWQAWDLNFGSTVMIVRECLALYEIDNKRK